MDYLECDGLDIDLIKIDDLEWWADEVWKLKSTWSPEGVVVYLTFLVDPQHEGNRKKERLYGVLVVQKHLHYPENMLKVVV